MTAKASRLRVLVVEDQDQWRRAIINMYKDILGKDRCTAHSAETAEEALEMLEQGGYDLLSLDINLSAHAKGGNGMDVLEDAAAEGLANGVVVITGAAYDEELEAAIFDAGNRKVARVALGPYVSNWFEGKNTVLLKDPDDPIEQQVAFFKRHLTAELLKKLAAADEEPPAVQPPYTLDITSGVPPRVIVKGRKGKEGKEEVVHDKDRMLLWALAWASREKYDMFYVSKEGVVQIARGQDWAEGRTEAEIRRAADTDIQTMRVRLRTRGILPEKLIVVERGKGWRLDRTVTVVGLGDVGGINMGDMERFADPGSLD